MTIENIRPVSIDYTSRDYYSLREALLQRVRERVQDRVVRTQSGQEWVGEDPADFGVALVEAFAYMGDLMSYYIDRVANESYLPTATQRQNILNLARSYGYTPAGYQAANVSVTFTNTSTEDVTVPAGTQLSGDVSFQDTVVQVIFTVENQTLVAANDSISVVASHGEVIGVRPENLPSSEGDVAGEEIGVSNGTPNQQFELSETAVVENSVQVYVEGGSSYDLWTRVDHLIDYGPNDPVYEVLLDADNVHYIRFGDGVSGAIPNSLASIKANYILGGGSIGNIAPNILTSIYNVPGYSPAQVAALSSALSVTNTAAAVGGTDPESNELIREVAPKALTALNRAVSLADFENLTLSVSAVGKANPVAAERTSVTVYMSPSQSDESTDLYPGMTAEYGDDAPTFTPTSSWFSLKTQVEDFLSDKLQIGTSLTVSPPSYVNVMVSVEYTKLGTYSDETAQTQITAQIKNQFGYTSTDFGAVITPEAIEFQLRSLPMITSAKVTALHRYGAPVGRYTLFGAPGEIFVFGDTAVDEGSISVEPASNNALLTSLLTSVGTLSPIFATNTYSYTLVVPDATTSVTFTPGATSANAVVYVNGVLATESGVAISPLAVGTTPVQIVVYAADNVTTKTYQVSVVRVV